MYYVTEIRWGTSSTRRERGRGSRRCRRTTRRRTSRSSGDCSTRPSRSRYPTTVPLCVGGKHSKSSEISSTWCFIRSETWVGLTLILGVPLSAQFCLGWRILAEAAWQLGNMVEHPNPSQQNPGLKPDESPWQCPTSRGSAGWMVFLSTVT